MKAELLKEIIETIAEQTEGLKRANELLELGEPGSALLSGFLSDSLVTLNRVKSYLEKGEGSRGNNILLVNTLHK